MVARTAYAQLRYSPLLLAGTVVGLALTYLAPVALTLFADGVAQFIGIFAWLLMAFAFRPTLRLYRAVDAVGAGAAGDRGHLYGVHRSIPPISMRAGAAACGRAAPRQCFGVQCFRVQCFGTAMNDASALRSGKGHRDENFPVASWLIPPRHRGPILAFYNFVRTADDIADHATLPAAEKLRCSIASMPA